MHHDNDGNISGRGLRFLETEVERRVASRDFFAALNARIEAHRVAGDVHEAAIDQLLADMAERQRADAEFQAAWNAMTYREAVAFRRARGL